MHEIIYGLPPAQEQNMTSDEIAALKARIEKLEQAMREIGYWSAPRIRHEVNKAMGFDDFAAEPPRAHGS